MKKWIFISFTAIAFFMSPVSWATTQEENSAAQSLVTHWFQAMKEAHITKAGQYLAPQFVSIHTDGLVRNKSQEIELIKDLHMQSYYLTDFSFSHSNNVIVVTFKDTGSELIDNKTIDKNPSGRMAILQKQKNKNWLIIAYANLDQIN